MRDAARIDRILADIGTLWKLYPDQRLGQLLENYVFGCERTTKRCIFHVEDDLVEAQLKAAVGRQ